MALFKSDEEKYQEAKNKILKTKEFSGRVGASNTGYSFSEGFRNTDKVRFKSTKFKIYDDKIMIERHRTFIKLLDILEIFQETDLEAIIILNNDDEIPIKAKVNDKSSRIEFKAFIDILKNLIEENKTNNNSHESNKNNNVNAEDRFDKLIKLGEMYDKGLLSDDEFASLKQELLSGNSEDSTSTSETDDVAQDNICKKCGSDISPEDAFCSECGNKL